MLVHRSILAAATVSITILGAPRASADDAGASNDRNLLQAAEPSARPSAAKQSRQLTALSTALFIGGTVATSVGIGYAGYRYVECGSFGQCSVPRPGLDLTADLIGWGLGGAALSTATYLYFTSGEEQSPPPARVSVGRDNFQLSVAGRF